MSSRKISEDTGKSTCSAASASGQPPSDSPESPMTDLFGVPLVPAKTSPSPEKDKAWKVRETYGMTRLGSSESATLTRSLESRLGTLLASAGSTGWDATWNRKRTPLGRQYLEHTASGLITEGSGCTGWPTPGEDNANNAAGHKGTAYQDLPTTAMSAAAWPTCLANEDAAGTESGNMQKMLSHVASTSGTRENGTTAATGNKDAFRLNPGFSLWLQLGTTRATEWLRCAERAMRSVSARRRRS